MYQPLNPDNQYFSVTKQSTYPEKEAQQININGLQWFSQ